MTTIHPRRTGRATAMAAARRMSLLLGTSALAALAALPALAQSAPAAQTAQATRTFTIPAQPLAAALRQFSEQSGIQLAYATAELQGLASPGVSGNHAPEDALRLLLAGSNVSYSFSAPNTVTLARVSGNVLPAVTAEGLTVNPNAQIGNLPPTYAGGQVATGARIGSLGNRNIFDTPYSVMPYTREQTENQQARMISDVLALDPSVTLNQTANPTGTDDVFNVRGFLTTTGFGSFDGLPGVGGRGGTTGVEQMERVEVLKGPSTGLRGGVPTFSVGGSINLVPKRAGDEPLTRVTTRYISESVLGTHADVGRRFGDNDEFGVRINAAVRNGDMPIDPIKKEYELLSGAFDYRGDRFRATLDLDTARNETSPFQGAVSLANGIGVIDPPPNDLFFGQKYSGYEQEKWRGVGRVEFDVTDNTTVGAAHGRLDAYEDYIGCTPTVTSLSGTLSIPCYVGASYTQSDTSEVSLRHQTDFAGASHSLFTGFSRAYQETGGYYREAAAHASNIYSPSYFANPGLNYGPVPGRGSVSIVNTAHLGDEISLYDGRVVALAALRHVSVEASNFNNTTGAVTSKYSADKITPTAALLVKPLDKLSLYGNFAEALEQGGTAPTGTTNAGQSLAPLESKQFEIGAKYDFGNVGLTAAAFDIVKENTFTNASNTFVKDGEQRHRGLELAAFGQPMDGIRLLGGVMLLDAETTKTLNGTFDGNRPIGVPEIQARLNGEADIDAVRGLTLTATVSYNGPAMVDASNSREIDGWYRLDLGARYKFMIDTTPAVLRFSVENVFDSNYWATVDRGSLFVSPPRTFLISTTVDF